MKLLELSVGDCFKTITGKVGKLIYKNDCRARVRLLKSKVISIKDRTFKVWPETDWSPYTEVIALPKKEKS